MAWILNDIATLCYFYFLFFFIYFFFIIILFIILFIYYLFQSTMIIDYTLTTDNS